MSFLACCHPDPSWPLKLPSKSHDSFRSFLLSLMGGWTGHRSMTVVPWVHHLTVVWLIYLIWGSNSFLAPGLLTCTNSQEAIGHQSAPTIQAQLILGFDLQLSNLKSQKRKHRKLELTLTWCITALAFCQIILYDKASICLWSQVRKFWNAILFYFQVHTGIRDHTLIRDQNV